MVVVASARATLTNLDTAVVAQSCLRSVQGCFVNGSDMLAFRKPQQVCPIGRRPPGFAAIDEPLDESFGALWVNGADVATTVPKSLIAHTLRQRCSKRPIAVEAATVLKHERYIHFVKQVLDANAPDLGVQAMQLERVLVPALVVGFRRRHEPVQA